MSVPCGSVLAGPDSPLVIYGDTSQDGLWYGGDPETVDGHEFGPKPFDPFYQLADADKEDDEWVFPLGNPFDHAGNDVIDASRLFAGLTCTDTMCSNLPSVGVTVYGGAGNDTIIGSQTGDYLAGGTGDDLILGLRGIDQIYGDSGINVDLLTRGLAIVNVNAGFTSPIVDPLLVPGEDVLYGEGAGTVGSAGTAVRTGYDDVIFGDFGVVSQYVTDPNLPSPLAQKIQTTGYIRDIATVRPDLGADDQIFGGDGRDRIFGGNGSDTIAGALQSDVVFGDHGHLQYLDSGTTDRDHPASGREHRPRARRRRHHHRPGPGDDIIAGGPRATSSIWPAPARTWSSVTTAASPGSRHAGGSNRPIDTVADVRRRLPGPRPLAHRGLRRPSVGTDSSSVATDTITTGIGRDMVFGGGGDLDTIIANSGETAARRRPTATTSSSATTASSTTCSMT